MLSPNTPLVSVDDHVIEPPNTWVDRAPAKFKDRVPKVVETDGGREAWSYEGTLVPVSRSVVKLLDGVVVPEEGAVRFDEMRPGCYDPKARLTDMDLDGVWAEVGFPNYARFAGHRFFPKNDPELSLHCLESYNDFILDEWCAAAPDRYIPLAIVPWWDIDQAIKETERVVAKGAKSIAFSENPTVLGLPSIHTDHWDPFLDLVNHHGLPMSLHFGSSSKVHTSSDDAPVSVAYTLAGVGSMTAAADWLLSGLFDRYPNIRLALSEGGAGWAPFILERADKFYRDRPEVVTKVKTKPSEAFKEHIYLCLVTDAFALLHLDEIGDANVMFEADFPHSDSEYPNSRTVFDEATKHLSAESTELVAHLNARRLYNFHS